MENTTTSPAHTAAPWEIGIESDGNGHTLYQILQEKYNSSAETSSANARLIAAAPELLEALKTLREDMRMLQAGEWEPDQKSCQASIDYADDAIAKAESR